MPTITAPGIYDISIDDYHGAEICPGPSISSSGLVTISGIMGGCPAKFWWDSSMNPEREPVDTEALRFGRAAHTLILEGTGEFGKRFGILGEGMDLRSAAGKAQKAAIEDAGKCMVRFDDFVKISAMAKAIKSHPRASLVFADGAAEKTLCWKDDETGVWLRARPDWLPTTPQFIPDYKTCADASKADFEKTVWSYGYHMKAAHVCAGIRATGIGNPDAAYFVAQEKKAPYLCAVYVLNKDALDWGDLQNRAAIRTFAECLNKGKWPGYAETAEEIKLPVYAENQLAAADLSGVSTQEIAA